MSLKRKPKRQPLGRFFVAHSKSALKRWRQNERHRARNKPVRTAARTAARTARTAIAGGTPDEARAAIGEAASIIDRAAKRRVIHPNAASRHKSRLMRQLNKAGAAAAAPAEAPKRARKAAATKPAAKAAARPKAAAKPKAPAKPRATKKSES
jgi:small subunit ribosomal protein S20